MSVRSRTLAFALLAVVIGGASAHALTTRESFPVTSTLDGKRVLPLRMHWLAYPKLPPSKIARVDFVVDGKLRWTEHHPPYNYGSDDNGRNLGYLITTWLSAGRHRFSVRVIDTSGRTSTDTVISRVLPAPSPPAALRGIWTRRVKTSDLAKSDPKYGSRPPAGSWKLVFDRVGAWHLDPLGSGVVHQYTARPGVIRVYAPIVMAPEGVGVSRFGYTGIGPKDCTNAGPFGTYRWSVSGAKLALSAIHEACGQRRAIWEGVWQRVG